MTAFALILVLGSAGAFLAARYAPPRARDYLRLAAVLYAALGIAEGFGIAADAVADIVAALGAGVLGVAAFAAFRRPPPAVATSLVLFIAALCGIGAAATDWPAMAAAPQLIAALALLVIGRPVRRRAGLYLGLAGFALIGSATCAPIPGAAARAGMLLFAAASVLGVALASDFLVENGGARRR